MFRNRVNRELKKNLRSHIMLLILKNVVLILKTFGKALNLSIVNIKKSSESKNCPINIKVG